MCLAKEGTKTVLVFREAPFTVSLEQWSKIAASQGRGLAFFWPESPGSDQPLFNRSLWRYERP